MPLSDRVKRNIDWITCRDSEVINLGHPHSNDEGRIANLIDYLIRDGERVHVDDVRDYLIDEKEFDRESSLVRFFCETASVLTALHDDFGRSWIRETSKLGRTGGPPL